MSYNRIQKDASKKMPKEKPAAKKNFSDKKKSEKMIKKYKKKRYLDDEGDE